MFPIINTILLIAIIIIKEIFIKNETYQLKIIIHKIKRAKLIFYNIFSLFSRCG